MWHFKSDYYSLFRPNEYGPVDGLRSISCLMIIAVHVITFLNSFITPYPSQEWKTFLKSYSFRLSALLSLSLETFFLLSGFLLTLKCLKYNPCYNWKEYLIYIIRRACRFWPGILLISIVMLILGEPKGDWMSIWLFYQNYIDIEQWSIGMAALWSISLDMQMHILLPIILYLILNSTSNKQRNYKGLYLLIILSIVYSIIVFNPETMNMSMLASQYNLMELLMPPRIFDWITAEYNVTFAFQRPTEPSPIQPFMRKLYLPLISRYSSFIIGSILAAKITDIDKMVPIYYGKIKKYLYLTLISLFMLVLAIPPESDAINPVVFTIMISIIRQLFSTSVAFILFCTICPSDHPYHSTWIRWFLSLPIWTPIAKLSYLVYVLHFRIAFELITSNINLFHPKQYSIDILAPICVLLTFTISAILGAIWFLTVEKPFERWTQRILPDNRKAHRY